MDPSFRPVEPSVPARWLLVALAGVLAADVVLLQPFLGLGWGPAWALVAAVLLAGVARAVRGWEDRVGWRTLACCFGIALVLLMLGGEGRLFHANLDWRVRDAVLRDMAVNPWPFAYTFRGAPEVLRAPLGMYLLPALAMKRWGQAAGDGTLLLQNAVVLALILALGATLFVRRWTALIVFVAFSGLDIVGGWLASLQTGRPISDHLESWASPLQYTAHLTQLFWVPQHAFAGWIGALSFALWRERKAPLGVFLALVPLTILWSPLGAAGAIPFAILAGMVALVRRELRPIDVALPALACLLVVPVLLYLSADTATVGARPVGLRASVYIAFVALEVVPLLLIARWSVGARPLGRITLALVAGLLLFLPLGQVGWASDFVMRVSIAPLALLALMVADAVIAARGARLAIAVLVLGAGAVTGWHEVRRAIVFPRSPAPRCTFYHAWGPGPAWQKSTYLAAVARLPAPIRPGSVTPVADTDPPRCWDGRWPVPTGAME